MHVHLCWLAANLRGVKDLLIEMPFSEIKILCKSPLNGRFEARCINSCCKLLPRYPTQVYAQVYAIIIPKFSTLNRMNFNHHRIQHSHQSTSGISQLARSFRALQITISKTPEVTISSASGRIIPIVAPKFKAKGRFRAICRSLIYVAESKRLRVFGPGVA